MTTAESDCLRSMLKTLVTATEKLQAGLRRVDSEAILQAVGEQAEAVAWLEGHGEELREALTGEELRLEFARISELNAHNQVLSMCGLRSIAQTMNRIAPPTGYGDTGEPQAGLDGSNLKASV